tara:strand:- start:1 stop:213 length:213 start_codon:yes stop_codon:yes gene_type:complete
MKNRYSSDNNLQNNEYEIANTNYLKKSKTVDINILLNRIKADKNRANLNNLKKFSFWLSIICITGLLIII